MPLIDQISVIKAGLSTAVVNQIGADLGFGSKLMRKVLNLKGLRGSRAAMAGGTLRASEGERMLGLARLIGQVEVMVKEAGDTTGFDAAAWFSNWLREPLPALGSDRGLDLLDTMQGQALISRLLSQMQTGAFV